MRELDSKRGKRTQNLVAESRLTLPVVIVWAVAVWIAYGLLSKQLWMQFACFGVSSFLMMVLNNVNVLIRIYSRMVSCSFLVLSCAACFLFDSMGDGIVQLCIIASYLTLFRTYQDNRSVGWTFYAFLCIGLASLVFVQIVYFLPFLWLLMSIRLNALSWRTWGASLLGLLTPYWFVSCLLVYQGDFDVLINHILGLAQFAPLGDYSSVTLSQLLAFILIVALALTGAVHYWRQSYNDKIRVRQLYGFFLFMNVLSVLFLVLQPQHYGVLLRLLIVNTAPLIAHFISLTRTRVTNIAFYVIVVACFALTAYHLWTSSLSF